MEKGEGVQLARKYRIRAFPSLLFVDGNGEVVHQGVGYHDESQILELAKVAHSGEGNMAMMEERFTKGDRDPEFLLKYTMARAELMNDTHLPVAEAYLAGQSDWSSPNHLDFIYSLCSNTESKLFDYLLDNRKLFEDRFGQQTVEDKIRELVELAANSETGEAGFAKIDALFARVYPERAKSLSANYRMSYYRQQGDRLNFGKAAMDYMKNNKTAEPEELNDLAWTFYRVIEDKKMLKAATKWTKRAIKQDPQVYYYDTLASLYEKMGLGKKAIKTAKKGMALAQEQDADDSVLRELVERLGQ